MAPDLRLLAGSKRTHCSPLSVEMHLQRDGRDSWPERRRLPKGSGPGERETMHTNELVVRHHQRLLRMPRAVLALAARSVRTTRWRCAIALTVLAVVATACSVGPQDTNRMTGTSTSGGADLHWYDATDIYVTGASCNGGFGGCVTEWSAKFEVQGDLVTASTPLWVTYSGSNAGAGFQFISVWNWDTMSWVAVDAFRVVAWA